METTHLLLARSAALERALEQLLKAIEGYHPDSWPWDVQEAVKAAREALDD